jgi:hypothetical protein
MSKNIKQIIAASVVLLVLAGVLVALNLTDKSKDNPSEPATTTEKISETLADYSGFDAAVTDIVSIDIKNPKAEYTILNNNGTCKIEGVDYAVNSSIIDTIPSNAFTVSIINKPSGTGDYGFENPRGQYTLNFKNNRSMTVIIGNKAVNNLETYVKLNDNVFTVSSYLLNPYLEDTLYYLETVIFPSPENADDKKIESVSIKLPDSEYSDITISKRNDLHGEMASSPYGYMMTSPANVPLNSNKANVYVTSLFGLTADKVIGYTSDSSFKTELLGTVVFTNPNVTLEIYKATEDSDLDYYVFTDLTDLVYGFTALVMTDQEGGTAPKLPWLEVDAEEIVSVYTISDLKIWQYRSLVIKTPEKQYNFTFNASGERDTFLVQLDGKVFDRDRFQKFNLFLVSGYIDQGNFAPSKGESIAEITITMDYGEVYTVEYFEDTSNITSIIAEVNGEPLGTLNISYKTGLLKNLSILNTEEDFVERQTI